jgi:large subunit ribosomal protein L25
METFKLEAQVRANTGRIATKSVRTADAVPCNVYGGTGNLNFSCDYNTVKKMIYTDKFVVAEITLEGRTFKAIIKEIQFHPVSDRIIHVDFQELVDGKKVTTYVPLSLKGFAKGQQAGGKLEMKVRKIKIKADADKIPSKVEVDVTNLEMGKSIRVKDIIIQEGVEILTGASVPVALVSIPRAMRGQQAKG